MTLSDMYIVRLAYAGSCDVSFDDATLIDEPHHLVLQTPAESFRLTDCHCQECTAGLERILAMPLLPLEEIAARVASEAKQESDTVGVLVHPDMLKPLTDGSPSAALEAARAFSRAVSERGCNVGIIDPACLDPEPGSWVRFTADQLIEPANIVLAGMLGQVEAEEWGVCTPGVSLMVRPTGASNPYGYFWQGLELLESEPSAEEIEASRALWRRALVTFTERHGWCGLVPVGGERLPEERARRDLVKLSEQLERHAREGHAKDVAGLLKRAAKVLKGFEAHPTDGRSALELARLCAQGSPEVEPLASQIRAWASAISNESPNS